MPKVNKINKNVDSDSSIETSTKHHAKEISKHSGKKAHKDALKKHKVQNTKQAKNFNLGETYGDESFQITTQKVEKNKQKNIDHNKIEKELENLPIVHRHGKYSFNEYLIFFGILLIGIVVGTIITLGDIRTSSFRVDYSRSNSNNNTTLDLVSNGNVLPSAPARRAPSANQASSSSAGPKTIDSSIKQNPVTTTNNNGNLEEFNNGKYKVYQQRDGSLVIAW